MLSRMVHGHTELLERLIEIKSALMSQWIVARCILKEWMDFSQVVLHAGPRQRGVSDHDGPAGGDGVRHGGPEAAAVRPDRQEPGEQEPSQAAAQEVRRSSKRFEFLNKVSRPV